MARRRPFIVTIWLAATLFAWPASDGAAQDGVIDLFAATVAVDETAASAVVAKSTAMARVAPQALRAVLERLTVPEDRPRLPLLERETVESMVRSLSVADEKSALQRYLARVTVSFHPESVRRLLRDSGVSYSESQAPAALVVPVLQRRADLALFSEENVWLEAWQGLAPQSMALTPVVTPIGDLEDLTALEPRRLIDGDRAALLAAADRYGAKDALLALGVLQTSPEGAPKRLDVSLTRYPRDGEESLTVESYVPAAGEDLPGFLTRAAGEIVARLGDDWRELTRLRFDQQGELLVTAEFIDLADWVAMRGALRGNPVVQRMSVESITLREAQVRLDYLGDEAKLATALARAGLNLVQDAGFWRLNRLRRP